MARRNLRQTQYHVSCLTHMAEEMFEVLNDPYNPEEYADCLILLLGAARNAGISADQLIQAAHDKHLVNTKRTWEKPDAYVISRHVKW